MCNCPAKRLLSQFGRVALRWLRLTDGPPDAAGNGPGSANNDPVPGSSEFPRARKRRQGKVPPHAALSTSVCPNV
jgi:hypothetical protein